MRRPEFEMAPAEALSFLADAPAVHLAFTSPGGAPVVRTLHPVVVGGAVAFHGSPVGEKMQAAGLPVVLQAEETVAGIPSYFLHPERACPATTLYRSVQVHGILEAVTDPARKADVLQALMEKYQPEGGYQPINRQAELGGHPPCVGNPPDVRQWPITGSNPMYRAAVAGLGIFQIPLVNVTGKAKLGQNRTPDELRRLLEALWHRGAAGDARAIELISRANPATPVPGFLVAPPGTSLHVWCDSADAGAAADLLADTYWNRGVPREVLLRAHVGSTAWVAARDRDGVLIGSARAVTDGGKWAWLYDVVVAPAWRGRGVGQALVRLVLDHPAVRQVRNVALGTRDAQGLYARFGFVDRQTLPPKPYRSTEMVLVRPAAHGKMSVLA